MSGSNELTALIAGHQSELDATRVEDKERRENLLWRIRRDQLRTRDPSSPCWTTKQEMGLVKATVDAGNPTEARELSQKVGERIKECQLSPCFMTKEEGASIKAAYAAGDSKLGKELSGRSRDRSNKCWGR